MNNKDANTYKSLEIQIKELELEIAKLRLNLAEKEQKKERLREQQGSDSLGIDRNERAIQKGDKVQLLTPSKAGPFKGEKHAIVVGRSRRHPTRILISKIGDTSTTTNREPHNINVVDV